MVEGFLKLGAGAGIAIAIGLGLFGRLNELGSFPLALDEYYWIQSVKAILEHGVPSHETGGYYTRGLLLQYMTAASVLLLGDGAFAYRLPAALFSLATVPLAYVYGRRLLGTAGAVALAVILLISAWEIEFGRFARMYAALQFVTLAFLVAVHKAFDDPRRPWLYLPHVIALVAIFVHEFAVLLTPFLFLPALSVRSAGRGGATREWFVFALVSSTVTLLCYRALKWSSAAAWVGVADPYPADIEVSFGTPWLLPVVPFFSEPYGEVLLLLGLGLAAAIVCAFLTLRLFGRSAKEGDAFGALLLVSAALHQFLVTGAIASVMLARHRTVDFRSRRLQTMVALTLGLGVLWLTYALSSRDWVANTFRPEYGFSPNYSIWKGLIRTFLGWPSIIDSVVLPWLGDLPLIGAAAIVAAVYQIGTKAHAGATYWVRGPLLVIAAMFLVFGVRDSPYSSIRYSFFIYPVVIALILLSATDAARAIVRRLGGTERIGSGIGVSVSLILFLASSDFNLRQIINVADQSVRLRLGEFQRYESIWYYRWDYESPATFINERGFSDDDRVVVVGQPPVSFYLRVPHGTYYARDWPLFYDHSRAGGTLDRWSNQRLFSTDQDLRAYTRCAANVWIVRPLSPQDRPFEIEDVWGERLMKATDAFRGRDDRLVVTRVELKPELECGELLISSITPHRGP